jgi:hypothetical protein
MRWRVIHDKPENQLLHILNFFVKSLGQFTFFYLMIEIEISCKVSLFQLPKYHCQSTIWRAVPKFPSEVFQLALERAPFVEHDGERLEAERDHAEVESEEVVPGGVQTQRISYRWNLWNI